MGTDSSNVKGLLAVTLIVVLFVKVISYTWIPQYLLAKWTDALSWVINVSNFASGMSRTGVANPWKKRLVSTHHVPSCDGDIQVPTCAYRWPNGQGDVAKFLEGQKNSRDWSSKHGGVYRIWSGMTPEM